MKKVLFGTTIVLLLFFALIVITIDSIAQRSLQALATDSLHTQVTIGSARLSLLDGISDISDITIANPEGYPQQKPLLHVDNIFFKVDLRSLFSPIIHVESIVINDPSILYIANGPKGSNFTALGVGKKSTQPEAAQTTQTATATAKPAKTVVIDRLVVHNASVTGNIALLHTTLTIPNITINHLGSKEGVTPAQAVSIGLQTILGAVIEQFNLPALAKSAGDNALNTADALGHSVSTFIASHVKGA